MENTQTAIKHTIAGKWKKAWEIPKFRILTIIGILILSGILIFLPFFFTIIEKREGTFLNDPFLEWIPAFDVSIPTFIVIWSMSLFYARRCIQDPYLFVLALWSISLIYFSRLITISVFPLNPPNGLIPLNDPLANLFYGGIDKFVKKDLFYSGHTSIQFFMFLSLQKKSDKIFAFFATLFIASFVLIQHIHYTIDVMGAFIFTYLLFRIGKMITRF
jgi:hypothetical protein